MLSTPATTEQASGDPVLPAPPDPGRAPVPDRKGARSAKWALVGLSVVGLSYVAVVDPNKPNLVPGCVFKAVTGIDCPGCGGTRAVHALLHGDIANALNHNVLATVAIIVGLVWVLTNLVRKRLGRPPLTFRMTMPWGIALMAAVMAFWILRNLPWSPFSWLGSGN